MEVAAHHGKQASQNRSRFRDNYGSQTTSMFSDCCGTAFQKHFEDWHTVAGKIFALNAALYCSKINGNRFI